MPELPPPQPLILSLFPGLGLLDMAFEELGFCVVRGPDPLWGGRIETFHPPRGRPIRMWDGIIGGPPCQAYSALRHMIKHKGQKVAPDLIPEFARCVNEARPDWFLMENVPAAPAPDVPGYDLAAFLLNNRWIGAAQNRLRRFVFGTWTCPVPDLTKHLPIVLLECWETTPSVLASGTFGPGTRKRLNRKEGPSWKHLRESLEAQGLPADYLDDAPLTVRGAQKMIGNGVPLPMGRALARAIMWSCYPDMASNDAEA